MISRICRPLVRLTFGVHPACGRAGRPAGRSRHGMAGGGAGGSGPCACSGLPHHLLPVRALPGFQGRLVRSRRSRSAPLPDAAHPRRTRLLSDSHEGRRSPRLDAEHEPNTCGPSHPGRSRRARRVFPPYLCGRSPYVVYRRPTDTNCRDLRCGSTAFFGLTGTCPKPGDSMPAATWNRGGSALPERREGKRAAQPFRPVPPSRAERETSMYGDREDHGMRRRRDERGCRQMSRG